MAQLKIDDLTKFLKEIMYFSRSRINIHVGKINRDGGTITSSKIAFIYTVARNKIPCMRNDGRFLRRRRDSFSREFLSSSLSADHEREEYISSHEDWIITRKSICVKTPRLTEL